MELPDLRLDLRGGGGGGGREEGPGGGARSRLDSAEPCCGGNARGVDPSLQPHAVTFAVPPERRRFHQGDLTPAVASGVVCALLNMTLSMSLAAVVYESLPQYIMLGFDCNNVGIVIACAGLSLFSTCPAYVGCTSAVTSVVFARMVAELSATVPDPEDALPTVLVSVGACSLTLGCSFVAAGRLRCTRLVQVFPQPLVCGFLAVVGASLTKYSAKIGGGVQHLSGCWVLSPQLSEPAFWGLYWPVPPLAAALFLVQRHGALSPPVLWGLFLCLPLMLFYTLQLAGYIGAGEWFMENMEPTQLSDIWRYGFQLARVRWRSVLDAVIGVVPLVPVILVDVLVAMAATRKAGELDPELDGDAELSGKLYTLQSVLLSPPTTNSGKLSLLNVTLVGARSGVPNVIAGASAACLLFLARGVAASFPRFYLGYLLLYSGLGFLVKNLYDSYGRMTKLEYIVPWAMVLIEMKHGLMAAIGGGFMISTAVFAMKYAQLQPVKSILGGGEARGITTVHVRTPIEEASLRHISQQLVVVQLQHYLFFGSVLAIDAAVEELAATMRGAVAEARGMRPRWLVLDWEHVTGMDSTLTTSFGVAVRKLARCGYSVVFTGMVGEIEHQLRSEGSLKQVGHVFPALHEGVAFVEDRLLERSAGIRSRWLRAAGRGAEASHRLAASLYREHILLYLLGDQATEVWRYARRRAAPPGAALCTAGERCGSCFFVQSGRLEKLDSQGRLQAVLHTGAVFNEWALLFGSTLAVCTVRAARGAGPAAVFEVDANAMRALRERDAVQLQQLQRLALKQTLLVDRAHDSLASELTLTFFGGHDTRPRALSTASSRPSSVGCMIQHTLLREASNGMGRASHPPCRDLARECFSQAAGAGGVLPASDLVPALLALGCDMPPGHEAGKPAAADVSEAEFEALVASLPGRASAPLQAAFSALAAPYGQISEAALRAKAPWLSPKEAADMIADVDFDSDGSVDWVEFAHALGF